MRFNREIINKDYSDSGNDTLHTA